MEKIGTHHDEQNTHLHKIIGVAFMIVCVVGMTWMPSNLYASDFQNKIHTLSLQIPEVVPAIKTEEATKNSLIMPFISALGYDVFYIKEVVPEYTADVGVKQGEKVDYAILRDGIPIMLIECKSAEMPLNSTHINQLMRYFSVTEAKIGILTNGIVYQFFSDLEHENRMDPVPFFAIDLRNPEPEQIQELMLFTKDQFDIKRIRPTAEDLKYTQAIKAILHQELAAPSPSADFVYFLGKKVYDGRMTKSVQERFSKIVRQAFHEFVEEQKQKK